VKAFVRRARRGARGTARGIACGLAALALVAGSAAGSEPERFDVVVLDAGHGGEDTGARGPDGALEKDVALQVVRRLAARLRAHGLKVVLTRDRDEFVPLERRTAIANDARGDLFLSIHLNAAPDPEVRGTETFFLSEEASDPTAAVVATRENQAFRRAQGMEVAAVDDPFIALLGDMIATEYLRESSELAHLLQGEVGTVAPLHARGVKQALFVVLNGVQMPAALVEIGFITNRHDERLLGSPPGQGRVVDALERAVVAFGQRYDARHGAGAPSQGRR
jgi:N-acetylmuramoyl-L-alanine amidase